MAVHQKCCYWYGPIQRNFRPLTKPMWLLNLGNAFIALYTVHSELLIPVLVQDVELYVKAKNSTRLKLY